MYSRRLLVKKNNQKKWIRVNLFDRKVVQSFLSVTAALSTIAGFYSVFGEIPDKPVHLKAILSVSFVLLLILIYFTIWIYANNIKHVHLKINGTNVRIFAGDIFEQENLKVIGVNEYFDTTANNKPIANKTLHGKFLAKFANNIPEIDQSISDDENLKTYAEGENAERIGGKKIKYKLGSMFEYDSYILTAFAKFDKKNKAYLYADDYVGFWMSFWENLDAAYAGQSISIPLMGAGITRFRGVKPTKQQLLEIMLWTLKASGFQCTYNDQCVNFVIYQDDADDIDFYHLSQIIFGS